MAHGGAPATGNRCADAMHIPDMCCGLWCLVFGGGLRWSYCVLAPDGVTVGRPLWACIISCSFMYHLKPQSRRFTSSAHAPSHGQLKVKCLGRGQRQGRLSNGRFVFVYCDPSSIISVPVCEMFALSLTMSIEAKRPQSSDSSFDHYTPTTDRMREPRSSESSSSSSSALSSSSSSSLASTPP